MSSLLNLGESLPFGVPCKRVCTAGIIFFHFVRIRNRFFFFKLKNPFIIKTLWLIRLMWTTFWRFSIRIQVIDTSRIIVSHIFVCLRLPFVRHFLFGLSLFIFLVLFELLKTELLPNRKLLSLILMWLYKWTMYSHSMSMWFRYIWRYNFDYAIILCHSFVPYAVRIGYSSL